MGVCKIKIMKLIRSAESTTCTSLCLFSLCQIYKLSYLLDYYLKERTLLMKFNNKLLVEVLSLA